MILVMTVAVAIAAFVLSAISLAFTAYQWRRSGPALVVMLSLRPTFESSTISYGRSITLRRPPGPLEPVALNVEVLSAGRMSVNVRKVILDVVTPSIDGFRAPVHPTPPTEPSAITYATVSFEPTSSSQELPATLGPTAVLECEFLVQGILDNNALMTATARAQYGSGWVESRPLRITVERSTPP